MSSTSDITESVGFYSFLAWLEVNKKRLIIALSIAAFLALVGSFVFWRGHQKEIEANGALLRLGLPFSMAENQAPPTAQAYLEIAKKYPNTSAGKRAWLLAAGALYTDGKYAEARQQFEQFRSTYKDSDYDAIIRLGVATCLDAENQIEAAAQAYQEVITQYAEDPIAAQAKLALARIHQTKNQPELAYKLLEEVARQTQRNAWQADATAARDALLLKYPHLAPTNPPPSFSTVDTNQLATNVRRTNLTVKTNLLPATNTLSPNAAEAIQTPQTNQ